MTPYFRPQSTQPELTPADYTPYNFAQKNIPEKMSVQCQSICDIFHIEMTVNMYEKKDYQWFKRVYSVLQYVIYKKI